MTARFPRLTAGPYRAAEKAMQLTAARPDVDVMNVAGPVWEPIEYTTLDGEVVRVEPRTVRGIPRPTAYFRQSIIFPVPGPDGEPLDVVDGLARARMISWIVPNAQDLDVYVMDHRRFIVANSGSPRSAC